MRGLNVRHQIRRQDVSAFALSLPLLVVSAFLLWQTAADLWLAPSLVAVVAIHLSLLLRSRLPWVTLGITGIGALTLLGAPAVPAVVTGLPGALPAVLIPSAWMFGVAVYSVAAHARSYRPVALLLGITGAAELTAGLWNGIPWLLAPTMPEASRAGVAAVSVLCVLLAYACGRWRALSGAHEVEQHGPDPQQDRDTSHLDHAVALQQTRMAREVHRSVMENLDEILSRAREGRVAARRAPALAADALTDITQQGEEAFGRVQTLLALLDDPAPQVIDPEPQGPVLVSEHALSPQPQLADLPRLIDGARGQGLAVALAVEGERAELPVAGQLALYRAAQEALTNTVLHAGPGAVAQVELCWGAGEVTVTVEDEVSAREVEELGESLFTSDDYVEGRGLRVVRERLEALGGHLEVDQLDTGYRVHAAVPRGAGSPLD